MEDDLIRRAYAAYFRAGGTDQPASNLSGMRTVDGRRYVALRNINGTLAIYRVRNDGMLKRLKRWPAELESS